MRYFIHHFVSITQDRDVFIIFEDDNSTKNSDEISVIVEKTDSINLDEQVFDHTKLIKSILIITNNIKYD